MNEKKLREELTAKFIELGQLTHREARNKHVQDEEALQISKEICIIEKKLYEISGKYIPSKEEKNVPVVWLNMKKEPYFVGIVVKI